MDRSLSHLVVCIEKYQMAFDSLGWEMPNDIRGLPIINSLFVVILI